MWWQAAVLFVLLLPQVGHSDVLTFGVWPVSNPASGVSCRIDLKSGQINVVEVRGAGMPPKSPLRWPVRRGEGVRSDCTGGPFQWRLTQRRRLPVAVAPGMVAKAVDLRRTGPEMGSNLHKASPPTKKSLWPHRPCGQAHKVRFG